MKHILGALLVLTALSGTLSAQDYSLEQQESVNLSGITRVAFDLRGVNCSLCVRHMTVESELLGNYENADMSLSLTGDISSNRRNAVPQISVEKNGNTLLVRLYPESRKFSGLSQSGTAQFTARIPSAFTGELAVIGSSRPLSTAFFNLETIDIRSSSGDLALKDVRADTIKLQASSGNISGTAVESEGDLIIDSSSGDIAMGQISGRALSVKASSGDIVIGNADAQAQMSITTSSGNVELQLPADTGFDARLSTGSGRIRSDFEIVGPLVHDKDIIEGRVNGGGPSLSIHSSSGLITLKSR